MCCSIYLYTSQSGPGNRRDPAQNSSIGTVLSLHHEWTRALQPGSGRPLACYRGSYPESYPLWAEPKRYGEQRSELVEEEGMRREVKRKQVLKFLIILTWLSKKEPTLNEEHYRQNFLHQSVIQQLSVFGQKRLQIGCYTDWYSIHNNSEDIRIIRFTATPNLTLGLIKYCFNQILEF